MKVLFLIVVWINLVFFLWESNFGNIDTIYEGDTNSDKQILLQSELSNNIVEEAQVASTENKIDELTQEQKSKSTVEPEVETKTKTAEYKIDELTKEQQSKPSVEEIPETQIATTENKKDELTQNQQSKPSVENVVTLEGKKNNKFEIAQKKPEITLASIENKKDGLTQNQQSKPSVDDVVTLKGEKNNKSEITQKKPEITLASTNGDTKKTKELNKEKNAKNNQNKTSKLENTNKRKIILTAGKCFQIGPFENTDIFDEWKELNKVDSSSMSLLKEETITSEQFMVFYTATENFEEAKENMERVTQAGIIDAWLFQSGEYKGGISLGLYDSEVTAKLRVDELTEMNINTELKVFHKINTALFSKISTKNNKSKRLVFLSANQMAIDCKKESKGEVK
ncbi:MAG: hypothetical protein KAH20_03535 [Methylococcales bacterium]|nr:hypothetical protein [Methylococcales bacterium]